jgi:hypothetical protein
MQHRRKGTCGQIVAVVERVLTDRQRSARVRAAAEVFLPEAARRSAGDRFRPAHLLPGQHSVHRVDHCLEDRVGCQLGCVANGAAPRRRQVLSG